MSGPDVSPHDHEPLGLPAWSILTALAFIVIWMSLQLLVSMALILFAALSLTVTDGLAFDDAVQRVQGTPGDVSVAILSVGGVLLSWIATFALIRLLLRRFPTDAVRTALGFVPPQPRIAMLVAIPLGVLVLVTGLWLVSLLRDADTTTPLERLLESTVGFAAVAFLAVGIAPLAEEAFFRGFLWPPLARRFSAGTAMAANAAIFAAVHIPTYQDLGYLPAIFLMGFMAAGLRNWSGSVWPPILLHLVYNGTSLVLFLISPER